MLQFILGAGNTGKTHYLHKKIKEYCEKGGDKLLLIVPEQFTYETEKSLLGFLGARLFSKVSVTSFSRFAGNIFKELGGAGGEPVSEPARLLLMSLALSQIKDELSIYSKNVSDRSFPKTMLETINELKNAGIEPDGLLEASKAESGMLSEKLSETALIYSTYNALLYAEYTDPLEDITKATRLIEGKDFFSGYTVVLDEFKGFTANENGLLRMMFKSASEVYISLCIDTERIKQSTISPFASVKATMEKLMRLARADGVAIKPHILLDKNMGTESLPLIHLERNLFSPVIKQYSGENSSVFATACKNEVEEAEYTAAMIAGLIRENGLRYNDIAVLSRDMSTYMTPLQVAFSKYDLPYFSDYREAIDQKPLIRFVRNAISCVTNSFQGEDMLGLLKCGLTKYSAVDVAALENYVYVWNVRSGAWAAEFSGNPQGYREGMTDTQIKLLARINEMRDYLYSNVKGFCAECDKKTGDAIAKAIFKLLDRLEIRSTIEKMLIENAEDAREHAKAWEILMELLNIMAVTLKGTTLSLKQFGELYISLCGCYDLGTLPQSLDCVVLGDCERVRLTEKKIVFVLGVNENVFPAMPSQGGIFTDKEKQRLLELNMELSPPLREKLLEERFIAYKTLCVPSDRLYLTYRKADVAGKSMMPSIVISQLVKMFSKQVVNEANMLSNGELCCKNYRTAFSFIAKSFFEQNEFNASLREVLSGDEIHNAKLLALDNVAKAEHSLQDKGVAKALFGESMKISPTRVESFYRCRFRYFCEHGLRIMPLRRAELNPMETGTLIHSIIHTITTTYDLKNNYDEAAIKKSIALELDKYIEIVMDGTKTKTKRFLYLYRRMCGSIFKVVERIHDELSISQFEPCGFEYDIDEGSDITPLVLETADGATVTVAGKVDRIDKYINQRGEKYIRIIDYKSGTKKFKLSDVVYGMNLQMLIYLFCIWHNGKGEYASSIPAGILYMPAGEQPPSLSRDANEGDITKELQKQYRMNGLILENAEVIDAMEKGHRGVFVPVSTNKDGEFSKKTKDSLASLVELSRLDRYIEKLIADMATELHTGRIEAVPLEDSCSFCDYKSVCGGERDGKGCREYSRDEVFKLIEGGGAECQE